MYIEKPKKSHGLTVLFSIALGWLGIDRFYLGHTMLGIAKLATFVLSMGTIGTIWWIIDIILMISRRVDDRQFEWADQARRRSW